MNIRSASELVGVLDAAVGVDDVFDAAAVLDAAMLDDDGLSGFDASVDEAELPVLPVVVDAAGPFVLGPGGLGATPAGWPASLLSANPILELA